MLPRIVVENARRRFDAVTEMLKTVRPGASITVGFARLQAGDSTEGLIQRGDDEVSRARRRRYAASAATQPTVTTSSRTPKRRAAATVMGVT